MTSPSPTFRLLGSLEIDGAQQAIGGPRQQAMLAFLLLNSERAVPTTELIEAVWGDEPPATADAIVHGYVRRIRHLIAETGAVVRSDALGYRLELPDSATVDTATFASLAAQGTAALGEGRAADAERLLRQALDLWRGEPLQGLHESPFVARTRLRLASARTAAALARIEAALDLGESRQLVPELEGLTSDHPHDESVTRLLMLALVRSGGQAAALSAYRDLRRRLAEDLGIEPSAALQELEAAVLRQDPALLGPKPLPPPRADVAPRTSPRRGTSTREDTPMRARTPTRITPGVAGVAVLIALVVLIGPAALRPSGPVAPAATGGPRSAATSGAPTAAGVVAFPTGVPRTASPGATGLLPSTLSEIVASWTVPEPSCCGVSGQTAWGIGHHDGRLREINVTTNQMSDRGAVGGYQSGIPQMLAGSVWIPSARDPLVRFDPVSGQTLARIPVTTTSVVFGYLDVWASTRDHRLDRVSVESNRVTASIPVASGPNDWDDSLAIGAQAVWDSVGDTGELVKVDPSTNRIVDRIRGFGDTYSGAPIAFDGQAVWLLRAVGPQMTLFRVDASEDRIVAAIPVGSAGGGDTGTVAAGGGRVWTVTWDGTLTEIDEATEKVVAVAALPQTPQNISFGAGALWVDAYDANLVWRLDPARLSSGTP